MRKNVRYEGTGFNPEVVISFDRETFVKEHHLRFFKNRKMTDRKEMLKRVYDLCKEEMKRAQEAQ